MEYILNNFCGRVLTNLDSLKEISPDAIVYLSGDIKQIPKISSKYIIYVIKEFSYDYDTYPLIEAGKVPINIHNVGVYFRNFFESKNYFDLISTSHQFQRLTESTKADQAFRKGIYLSDVTESEMGFHYNLLRCSTNLEGPTDNFREVDRVVIDEVNAISQQFFTEPVHLNHVLAQIYENKIKLSNDVVRQRKAKIKQHSDKTKDMPRNGLIAFCTFYENTKFHKSPDDPYDAVYKGTTSVLTKLHFRPKNDDPSLVKEFSITLYPNSVFIIPLSTNRLYTHEIRPSVLPIDKIPVRMGYVIRCSKTRATYKDAQVFIDNVALKPATENDIIELRKVYLQENATTDLINYGDIYFSMNGGDYLQPIN